MTTLIILAVIVGMVWLAKWFCDSMEKNLEGY